MFGARAVDTFYPRGGGQHAPFVWVFRRRKTLGFLVGRCSASANVHAGGKSDVGRWPFEMVTGWPAGYLKKSQLSLKKEHLMGIYVFVSALEELIKMGFKKGKKKKKKILYLARICNVDTVCATAPVFCASGGMRLVGIKQRIVQTLGRVAEIIQQSFFATLGLICKFALDNHL